MHSTSFSLLAVFSIILGIVDSQTSTTCNPLEKTCPPNPGLGTSVFTDFTKGKSDYWQPVGSTKPNYNGNNGLELTITKSTDAPTMSMTKYIMFGHVDLVAKASPGTGIVSSFVLLSQDLDEIDLEWLGGVNTNVQTNFFGKGDISSYDRAGTSNVQTPIDSFHTYSIDWTAERTVWTIDGQVVRTLTPADSSTKGGKIYPQTPMEVKVGNWIGCLDMSKPETLGTCQWAGGQADLTKAPFTMSVKSINVTDYGCGGEYSYSDNSGSWQSIKSNGACDGKGTGPGNPAPIAFQAELGKADPNPENPATPNKPVNPAGNGTTPNPTGNFAGTASITPGTAAGSPNQNVSDANGKPKHTYGLFEFTVVALGLGLGYAVM